MRNRRLKDASLVVHGEKKRSFDDDDDDDRARECMGDNLIIVECLESNHTRLKSDNHMTEIASYLYKTVMR